MQFPQVTGANLDRRRVDIPEGFEGELNIVLIAFQRWHQRVVDTWIPAVRALEAEFPGVRYYEFPVIRQMNLMSRIFINEGMRAGIPDPVSRERTITLYVDKAAFMDSLALPHDGEVYVLVVGRDGEVYWRSKGIFDPDKGAALQSALHELLVPVPA
jgi:hypothetical protein